MSRLRKPSEPAIRGREAARLLAQPGPHRVLRGDLAIVGTSGMVFTPELGMGLPAVAFGHTWLTGVNRYRRLFEHLASWGIVVLAPNTERGPIPSHTDLAHDLDAALDVAVKVRLGEGRISVDPARLGFVGHGMGAGSAVLAAARREVAAVAALFPAPTAPDAEDAAAIVRAPGLVVAGTTDVDEPISNARGLAAAWGEGVDGGDLRLCLVDGASQRGIIEGRQILTALGIGGNERKTMTTTRALLTGFLLARLTDQPRYRAFRDEDLAELPRVTTVDRFADPEPEQPPSKLEIARTLLDL